MSEHKMIDHTTKVYSTEQLVEITKAILGKQEELTKAVSVNDFEKATDISRSLSELVKTAAIIKAAIQKEDITQTDVSALRDIKPKRKAIPNMLETEVAQTPKFEKMLESELGVKSPYEMRRGNLAWRENDNNIVDVITIPYRSVPNNLAELRKARDIERGTFFNNDTGMSVVFGANSVNEIIAKSIQENKRGVSVDARIGAMYQMKNLILHSVCFDSHVSDYNEVNSRNKSPNTLFMHQMYNVIRYDEKFYLTRISIEESYSTDRENKFNSTVNRVYNLKDIKITPVEANRVYDPAVPDITVGEDTSTDVVKVTIPQLYDLVKQYDKSFYENEQAPGRAQRKAEIAAQQEYEQSLKKLDKYNSGKVKPSIHERLADKKTERAANAKEALTNNMDDITKASEKLKDIGGKL